MPAFLAAGCASSGGPKTTSPNETKTASGPLTELTVEVSGLQPNTGDVHLEIVDSEAAWAQSSRPVAAVQARVTGATMRFVLRDVPSGTMAVRLFQDANGNGELDTNALGIPSEGYGFSGKGGFMGPPSFAQAAFEVVPGGTKTTISVR